MKKRVITGICIAPCHCLSLLFLPGVAPYPVAHIAVVALIEAASLAGCHMRYLIATLVILGTVPLYFRFFQIYMLWMMASAFIVITIKVFDRKTSLEDANRDLTGQAALVLFSNLFILVPFFYLYLLKELDELFPLILLFSIWGKRHLRYGIGKKFGKHPLAPRISPKKTVKASWEQPSALSPSSPRPTSCWT
jgi:phosphatidate cytidylyltransferase